MDNSSVQVASSDAILASEKKVKKLWLVFFIIVTAINLIWALFLSSGIFLFLLCVFTGTFYCSYLKPGTKILRLYLFAQVYNLYKIFESILFEKPPFQGFDSIAVSISLVTIGISSWLSYKLLKINEKKEYSLMLTIPEYRNIIDSIKTAQNREDLDLKYKQSLTKAPQIRKHIKRAFSEARAEMGVDYYHH